MYIAFDTKPDLAMVSPISNLLSLMLVFLSMAPPIRSRSRRSDLIPGMKCSSASETEARKDVSVAWSTSGGRVISVAWLQFASVTGRPVDMSTNSRCQMTRM